MVEATLVHAERTRHDENVGPVQMPAQDSGTAVFSHPVHGSELQGQPDPLLQPRRHRPLDRLVVLCPNPWSLDVYEVCLHLVAINLSLTPRIPLFRSARRIPRVIEIQHEFVQVWGDLHDFEACLRETRQGARLLQDLHQFPCGDRISAPEPLALLLQACEILELLRDVCFLGLLLLHSRHPRSSTVGLDDEPIFALFNVALAADPPVCAPRITPLGPTVALARREDEYWQFRDAEWAQEAMRQVALGVHVEPHALWRLFDVVAGREKELAVAEMAVLNCAGVVVQRRFSLSASGRAIVEVYQTRRPPAIRHVPEDVVEVLSVQELHHAPIHRDAPPWLSKRHVHLLQGDGGYLPREPQKESPRG
mmetsp:Transcript_91929/g.259694  ORF Transcript_91929/g.259694 Transcript_91929/m.259694 type:complete len:365 (+) Transcript_91929:881-1975(+)